MRKNTVIVTIDYETWQPIPKDKRIDWERDLIRNSEGLMEACETIGVKLTFMVEMCEYFWLQKNDPAIAEQVKGQIQSMILRGHDVQLHIHPNWMPQVGAKFMDGEWYWDWTIASCNDYPLDLSELIRKCKSELEMICQECNPNYSVQAFRAGAYRVQPFSRLYDALVCNNIYIDTSVYKGGKSSDRGYDFSKCKHATMPYNADRMDPQKENKNSCIKEFPISVWRDNRRLFLDNEESALIGKRFLNMSKQSFSNKNNYFCIIGHSKADHNYEELKKQLKIIANYPNTIFKTISEVKDELEEGNTRETNSIAEVREIMQYLYRVILPECGENDTPDKVLCNESALCAGYANTLGHILNQYGYKVKRVTLFADDMPKGRGKRRIDTHEVVSLFINDKEYVLDPTTNRIINHSIKAIIKNPNLVPSEYTDEDERHKRKKYSQYDTSFFYSRIDNYLMYPVTRYYLAGEPTRKYVYDYLYNYITKKEWRNYKRNK